MFINFAYNARFKISSHSVDTLELKIFHKGDFLFLFHPINQKIS